ncbi:6-phosphofructokinase [Dawidia soli]|uniref:ATP-dependent 6-phosphofructokinase n=1 Tax=Dawidia soli TaxID=2782352 RepID=A0AAP2DCK5_9BACT|nr:6-phosphofructokinase [Dawidia soli]MBT1688907.1 6-phosphofructokinase [Dawidia soli]
MSNKILKVGVFTSGGDAPGMNAAIRAVARSCAYYKLECFGIMRGYEGMIDGDIAPLDARAVGNILQRGGTVLKSARSKEFRTPEGRKKAYDQLKRHNIDALVAIGGDGTFTGLHKFYEEYQVPSILIPGTIDNDLSGTDYTIGYDTATNTAVEAIDKIRDTALSHNRLFFIEVMGRHSGYIAIHAGIAGGAASVVIPEETMSFDDLYKILGEGQDTEKKSNLVVVAEGSKIGDAHTLAKKVAERSSYFDIKVTVLGHLQRGGSPTYFDRVLASRMGVAAIEGLLNGENGVMVGVKNHDMVYSSFETVIGKHHEIDAESMRIAKILSI